ncbi:MAG: efflux RND transporter periplasmic adaptor subunit [Oscillospiraceae bacterium]|jgi:membrane fusion protein (multidrug efflux system)|nr:efflux RND transporter periplasmic adaptor subunit [Oscillospiraceae bacterium]
MMKRAALLGLLGITAATVTAMLAWPGQQPIPVRAGQAQTRDVRDLVEGTGSLGRLDEINVSSLSGGLVAQVYVTAGQQVRAGDPLLRLDAAAQEAALAQTLRTAGLARAAQTEAAQTWAQGAQWLGQAQQADAAGQAAAVAQQVAAQTLRAARDGEVLAAYIRAGESLLPGSPALRMGGAQQAVRMQVSERDALRVQPGMRARFLRDDALLGEGAVVSVGMPALRGDGVLTAAVDLTPDAPIPLPAGARVDVEIICRTQPGAVTVPLEALNEAEGAVWRIQQGRAWPVPVRVGLRDALEAAVQGVHAGDWIILIPPVGLVAGARVEVSDP